MRLFIIYIIVLICSYSIVFAQNIPYITSINKINASTKESVIIIGLNFPASAANLSVKFGAAEATIISTTSTLIEVEVPANATFDNISVTNTSTGLTAFSNDVFGISFGGNTFSTNNFDPIHIESSGSDFFTYDLCVCDFDNNGTNDIVTTNNESNFVSIYTNSSNVTTLNLSKDSINFSIPTLNTTCGDLDGDGKLDLVITRGGGSADRFFVLKNISNTPGTISFDLTNILSIQLPLLNTSIRGTKRPVIQDIDLDGKPDIILTNEADNYLFVYKNNSPIGMISFETIPTQIEIAGITFSSGLDVKDLNNDGFPEIIFIKEQANNIHILPNNSQPGTISLGEVIIINVNGILRNLKSGDLNQNGFNDIVVTSQRGNLTILKNTTQGVGGAISFNAENPIATDNLWGLDISDIEGDGDLDIVAASLMNKIYIFINNNPGNLSFGTETIAVTEIVRNIKVGDLNGDGKPDLAFTSRGAPSTPGQLGIIINRTCAIPKITPSSNQTICAGATIRLEATGSTGSYNWLLNNASIQNSANNFLNVSSTGGMYSVMLSDGNVCTESSSPIVITINSVSIGTTTASNSTVGTPVCEGTDVTLSATPISGAIYRWSGPNGFSNTSTGTTVTIPNIQSNRAGIYTLVAEKNGCTTSQSTTTVVIETVPVISVINNNQDVFCMGSSASIYVPSYMGFTYQWNKNGIPIAGQTTTSLTVTGTGNYSAVITSTNLCIFESQQKLITAISTPIPSFDISDGNSILSPSNSSICKGDTITFTATSQGSSGYNINNTWNFGDSGTGSGNNVKHAYPMAGTYIVTLTATYPDVQNCSTTEQTTRTITSTEIPTADISTPGGITEKCPSAAITLSIASNFNNHLWSSRESTSTISVSDPGSYTVMVTDEFGCRFTSNPISITNIASSGINIIGDNIDPISKNILLTKNQSTVNLSVENASANIAWTPSQFIADTTLTSITVFVQDINILVTVFANDTQGCMESDTVRILNKNIRAEKVFSPNGDGIGNDCWEITNSRDEMRFAVCSIFIFDSKGRILLQKNGPFLNDCVWDGNINGTPTSEGVYYYVLKCPDQNLSLSGAILLAR